MNGNALELLKQILEIPSVNSQDNEGAVAEFLADYFKEHGVQAEVQKIDDTHANVIAFVPGKNRERTMIWNGHLDTVPYGSLKEWQTDPAKTKELDGKLYARGSSDMKSGLAAMAYALCHLDGEPACNIQFLGTCDEEKGGLGAEMALKDGKMADGKWIKSNKQALVLISGVVIFLIIGLCVYNFWYKPYATDRDALRYYTFTNLNLRSSENAELKDNIIEMLPYGTELITYGKGYSWARVKANGKEGHVAAHLILSKEDFQLLDGVWGNEEAKKCVGSAHYRLAVIDYLKRNEFF